MLGKAETPILIMATCYIFIIGLIVVLCSLLFISVFNINHFVKEQKKTLVVRHCKIYLEKGWHDSYEGCVKQAIEYIDKQN
jgi:hypothetical protein